MQTPHADLSQATAVGGTSLQAKAVVNIGGMMCHDFFAVNYSSFLAFKGHG